MPIQFDRRDVPPEREEAAAQRFNGLPILLDRPMAVTALYLEPHGAVEEHSASVPTLFLVTAGHGFVRIGGSDGEMRAVSAGDAVLWPMGIDHMVWTEDEVLEAIAVEGPAERELQE